jgi:alkaline phosphatase D
VSPDDGFSRRRFLGLVAGAAAAGVAAGCSGDSKSTTPGSSAGASSALASPPPPPKAELAGDPFTLGVTSGDPAADSVVLWTRLLPDGGLPATDVPVQWEVSTDDTFASVVAFGQETATATDSFSIHAVAGGLSPATVYRYRFRVGDFVSTVGTTRTLPAKGATVDSLRFAFLSCQDYQDGFYTAYPHLVTDQPELVVFLGDFIYEEGPTPGSVRQHDGGEAHDLDSYRARYALYLKDSGLKAARAAAPWIVIWDDHEVTNDYSGDSANNGSGQAFLNRRAAGYKAWWENQPVRMAAPAGADLDINRSFDFGSLMSIVCLDGRQFRSPQVCETDSGGAFASLVKPCPDLGIVNREMLGTAQVQWAQEQLTASDAKWHVIANQVMLGDLTVPDSPLGPLVQVDQWDGYPVARTRFLEAIKASGATNPVVITGDLHASVVNTVSDGTVPVATEFLGPSVTSRFPLQINGIDLRGPFNALPATKPNLVFTDGDHHGYVVVTVTPDKMTAQYRVVAAVDQPSSDISTLATFDVAAGTIGPVKRA